MKTIATALILAACAHAQTGIAGMLELKGLQSAETEYKGKKAIKLTETPEAQGDGQLAILKGAALHNGTIEVWLSGEPGTSASQTARGFVGVAFRLQTGGEKYECFYLRPTNGRADDQVRRNHSAQYISRPDWPWEKLRKEFTEKYESYVDLVPGEWTQVKIEVDGTKARLYVHGATQPTLVVNDLKLGDATGPVAFWVGPGTIAHFSSLKVTPK